MQQRYTVNKFVSFFLAVRRKCQQPDRSIGAKLFQVNQRLIADTHVVENLWQFPLLLVVPNSSINVCGHQRRPLGKDNATSLVAQVQACDRRGMDTTLRGP